MFPAPVRPAGGREGRKEQHLLSTYCVHGLLEKPSEAVSEVIFNTEPHFTNKGAESAWSSFGRHTATLVHPFLLRVIH